MLKVCSSCMVLWYLGYVGGEGKEVYTMYRSERVNSKQENSIIDWTYPSAGILNLRACRLHSIDVLFGLATVEKNVPAIAVSRTSLAYGLCQYATTIFVISLALDFCKRVDPIRNLPRRLPVVNFTGLLSVYSVLKVKWRRIFFYPPQKHGKPTLLGAVMGNREFQS